jgi:hypothetical protein
MYAMVENGIPTDACDIPQAAKITGVSERLIRSWADAEPPKIWKGLRHGWRVMVSPAEIEAYNNRIVTVHRPGEPRN